MEWDVIIKKGLENGNLEEVIRTALQKGAKAMPPPDPRQILEQLMRDNAKNPAVQKQIRAGFESFSQLPSSENTLGNTAKSSLFKK